MAGAGPLQAVADGGGAGRGPGTCKEMPLPCKYLIKVTEIFSWPF